MTTDEQGFTTLYQFGVVRGELTASFLTEDTVRAQRTAQAIVNFRQRNRLIKTEGYLDVTRYITVVAMLVLAVGAPAKPSPQNQDPSPDVVDGAINPELIPDSTAYRLYLITVSEGLDASTEAKKRQLAYLSKVGLNENDLSSIVGVLARFKKNYTELVEQYNEGAKAAEKEGKTPDYQTFLLKRDALVQSTREDLRTVLSSEGSASLDALVKHEKKHMKIGISEAQR